MSDKKVLSKDLSHESLKAICKLRPSLQDTAAFFNVSEDTILRRCKEYESLTFAELRDKYMAETRLKLVNKAISMALNDKNTAMMIFCLKNLNKWQDKIDIEIDGNVSVNNFTSWAKKMNQQIEDETKILDVTPKDTDTSE